MLWQLCPNLQARVITGQFHGAVVVLRNRLHQTQTQPMPGVFASTGFNTVEPSKDIFPLPQWNTRSGVSNKYIVPGAGRTGAQLDLDLSP